MKCDWCERPATHTFKNGRHCCSPSMNSCPEVRAKNSAAHKGKNPFENREHPRGMLGKTAWNKGKTADSDRTVAKGAARMRKTRKADPSARGFTKGSTHSDATKRKIREGSKGNGGYRPGSGRGRKGTYKGIYCDSSWELAFVLWCELKGRQVKRAKKRFPYKYLGKRRTYLPDFRYRNGSGDWKYVEVKGYVSEQWKAKKRAFPHDLVLVDKRVISRFILPVVVERYGKDFLRLYE